MRHKGPYQTRASIVRMWQSNSCVRPLDGSRVQLFKHIAPTHSLGDWSPTCCMAMLPSVFNVLDLHMPKDCSELRKHSPLCLSFLSTILFVSPKVHTQLHHHWVLSSHCVIWMLVPSNTLKTFDPWLSSCQVFWHLQNCWLLSLKRNPTLSDSLSREM